MAKKCGGVDVPVTRGLDGFYSFHIDGVLFKLTQEQWAALTGNPYVRKGRRKMYRKTGNLPLVPK